MAFLNGPRAYKHVDDPGAPQLPQLFPFYDMATRPHHSNLVMTFVLRSDRFSFGDFFSASFQNKLYYNNKLGYNAAYSYPMLSYTLVTQ